MQVETTGVGWMRPQAGAPTEDPSRVTLAGDRLFPADSLSSFTAMSTLLSAEEVAQFT